MLVPQLPARGRDVTPATGADVRVHMPGPQHALELEHVVGARALEGHALDLVVADEVHVGAQTLGDRRQLGRLPR